MPISMPQHIRMILSHGEIITHYQGQICSCSPTARPEDADLTCVRCNGLGVFWRNPKKILAIITGLDSDRMGRQWLQTGMALPEDMSCSPLPDSSRRFRDYDKVIPMWSRGFPYPGELMIRGKKEKLLYEPQGKILLLSQINSITGEEKIWIQDVDFFLSPDDKRTISWASVNSPQYNSTYSVVYEPKFEFVTWTPPAPRWERGRDLGMRVLLRKVHLPWPASNWG